MNDSAHARLDSVTLANPPVPDQVARVFQFLFNDVPQWIQIGGVLLAAALAFTVVVLAWRYRQRIGLWLRTRSRGAKIALASTVGLIAMVVVGSGAATWNYVQHDNDFCVGCHVMTPAFDKFQVSEHSQLECHDCHQQSLWASAMELYVWVLHRPEEIPPHAKVPNAICANCHIRDRPDSTWERISATAGHRIHFESDSAQLKDVQCVTCHAATVHEFAPAALTCGQSGCHESTEIRLAGMRDQTSLHCAACHQFTAPVSEQASLDTARALIVPALQQCMGCHQMEERMGDFHPESEPHQAVCGTCHNPHEQETPAAAFESCATSGCHARADTITAFHRGIAPAALADCGSCHKAHSWQADAGSCLTCHSGIFDDAPAARPAVRTGGPAPQSLGFASDLPMSHRRHRSLECTSCHTSSGDRHGELTVRTTAQCQQCHHTPARVGATCTSCHQPAEIRGTRGIATTMRVASNVTKQRELPFRHEQHAESRCESCHAPSLTMAVTSTCTSCHAPHHQPAATCQACHATPRPVHTRQAHLGCVGCHEASRVASLQPVRTVCLGCHVDMVRHNAGRECAQCHQVAWRPGAPAVRSE